MISGCTAQIAIDASSEQAAAYRAHPLASPIASATR